MVLGEQVPVAQEVPVGMVQEAVDMVQVDMVEVGNKVVVAKRVDLDHPSKDLLEVGMQDFHHKTDCTGDRLYYMDSQIVL